MFEDVRAVISCLLENGVGELLQLGVVPFNFLQLILKLKRKKRQGLGKVQVISIEWEFIKKEMTTRVDVPVSKGMFKMYTFLDCLHESKAQRSQC